ncbi:methyl-accepting chemotaxis protein [Clostridium felsineum]|uniref:methyl-accepting chemotaxis protein n=1 Tax=Clostridium felsineum TaxID=36839 RepID=UPI00098BEE69|nr:methyl-accepting chemotaxis protein [Clostridium felsineum]URZ04590.1 hypothetical protein CLAUR_046790 [Clostridium felsineum]
MISIQGIEYIKSICESQADEIPGGVIYLISDGDTFTWRKASKSFRADIFKIGEKLNPKSVTLRAIHENRKLTENIPRSLYGVRLKAVAEPIVDEEGRAVGAFSIAFPVEHAMIKAFKDFAPVLSEMFSDGVVLFTTDLDKFISVQTSNNFKLPLVPGEKFKSNTTPDKVVMTKSAVAIEYDASIYGTPVFAVCHPVFEEGTGELVGTFGLMIPKTAANMLKDSSRNLEDSITEIVATIEELAASAASIHSNEKELNDTIGDIAELSSEINNVTTFIKEIADQTKMLGLNASIEAARAGELGKGFGVVAAEIRKLSEESKSTVPKIKELTDKIISKVDECNEKSKNSLSSSKEQAAATEEITASVQEINSMAETLNEIANKL